MSAEFEAFSLEVVCEMTGAPSVDWLSRRITSGETPAVLAGQHWRMTRADMIVLVEQMREAGQRKLADLAARRHAAPSGHPENTPADAGLSPRAAARMRRRKTDAA